MIDVVQRLQLGIAFQQQGIAEGVKGSHKNALAALSRGANHAMLHLARGPVRER